MFPPVQCRCYLTSVNNPNCIPISTDPNNPPCMKFYAFMSGRGVGNLRVLLQDVVSRAERVLWALAGNQGSQWIPAQLPLSSNTPFKGSFFCVIDMELSLIFVQQICNFNLHLYLNIQRGCEGIMRGYKIMVSGTLLGSEGVFEDCKSKNKNLCGGKTIL